MAEAIGSIETNENASSTSQQFLSPASSSSSSSRLSHTYIRSALEKGETTSFTATLQDFLVKIDNEMCTKNADYFLDSLGKGIKNVQQSIKEIANNLETVDTEVACTYADIKDAVTSHKRLSREKENISQLLNNLQACRVTIANMQTVRECMEKKNDSFAAATLLSMIKKDCKLTISSTKPFVPRVHEWCAYMSTRIINHAKEELFLYYEVINTNTRKIGDYVLSHLANQFIEMEHIATSQLAFLARTERILPDRILSASLSRLIKKYGAAFRWTNWAADGELIKSVPIFYYKEEQLTDDSVMKAFMNDVGSLNVSVHTFALFERQSEFCEFYRMTRGAMLSRIIWDLNQTSKPLCGEEIGQLVAEKGFPFVLAHVLSNIVGFFFIECTAKQLCEVDVLFNSSQLVDMFELACLEIDGLIRAYYGKIRNADICLQIKELLVLFNSTMSDETFNGGLHSDRLSDAQQYMWTEFSSVLKGVVESNTQMALSVGMYQPYFVSNQTQYNNHIKAFKLDTIETDFTKSKYIENTVESNKVSKQMNSGEHINNQNGKHGGKSSMEASMLDMLEEDLEKELSDNRRKVVAPPRSSSNLIIAQRTSKQNVLANIDTHTLYMSKTYPFSCALPAIIRDVYVMLCRLFLFLVYNPNINVTALNVCEVVESSFCIMANAMKEDMEKGSDDIDNVVISKICQIAIDATALSQSLVHIGAMIASALASFRKQEYIEDDVVTMITKCRRDFENLSVIAYEFLYDTLRHKLRELMSCFVFIEWSAKTSTDTCFEPIVEITSYLLITMQWLINMPVPVRENAHFMCCNTINEGIVSFITSSSLEKITVASLRDLEKSITHLETFADECCVRNLSLCFCEIRTLVNILLDESTLHVIDDDLQAFCTKHKNINMTKVVVVYEKLCDCWIQADLKSRAISKLKQVIVD